MTLGRLIINDCPQTLSQIAKLLYDRYEKGDKEYGKPIDNAVPPSGSWKQEALEELADAVTYLVKQNNELMAENERLTKQSDTNNSLLADHDEIVRELEEALDYLVEHAVLLHKEAIARDKEIAELTDTVCEFLEDDTQLKLELRIEHLEATIGGLKHDLSAERLRNHTQNENATRLQSAYRGAVEQAHEYAKRNREQYNLIVKLQREMRDLKTVNENLAKKLAQ